MRIALAIALAGALPAQVVATVNDPNSHGTVGNSLLSLDEAIQLANGTLAISSLSAAEQAQLSAQSGLIETIMINAATTPRITLQRVLSNVVGLMHAHVHIAIEGVSNAGQAPVLDGGTLSVVLPLRTNHAHVHNLVIEGGQVGIEYDTTLHFHTGEIGEIGEVDLEGQSAVALRVINPATPTAMQAPLMLHEVHIHDAPVGIEIRDDSNSGNIDISGEHVHIEHCDVGIDVVVGSLLGDHKLALMGAEIDAHEAAVRFMRNATSTSRWTLRGVHGQYHGIDCGFELMGNAISTTVVELHHAQVHAGVMTGSCALSAGPQNGHLSLTATETLFVGPVTVAAGAAGSLVKLHNNRLESGAVTLNLTGGQAADVQWTNFTSAPVTVANSTAVTVGFDTCEFVRSGLTDQSSGRVALANCFLGDSPLSGNINNQRPQANPWIGRASVAPIDPPVGTYTDLTLDLHAGTAAVWMLGLIEDSPITTGTPFRFYVDLTSVIVLPGLHQLHSRVRLPIPAVNSLRRSVFYLQPVQVPLQGQSGVPTLFLPVGSSLQAQ